MNPDWPKLLQFDQQHIWHPYSTLPCPIASVAVQKTHGSVITLSDGQTLIDGMSSWWACIHGYNHPDILEAMHQQIDIMPHIMFGGLTHKPAIELAQRLTQITPKGLNKVFFSDSGSVAMEVAIKIALQFWISQNQVDKKKILTVKNGYHGDTFATMAICDPENGMHTLFNNALMQNYFAPAPHMGFHYSGNNQDIEAFATLLAQHHNTIAAVTLEPIVQGAGGMRFYRPDYLKQVHQLCRQYNVLLIADEIATGFGRTGKLFACNWAEVSPDILCLGKALTGGNISLAATLTTDQVSKTIHQGNPGILMHGPTFMANPLACATAIASLDLLLSSPWQQNIQRIEKHLTQELLPLKQHPRIQDVRVLGAIGVIELEQNNLADDIQKIALQKGVWLRPFRKLVYTMPAYNIPEHQLTQLTDGLIYAVKTALAKFTS